MASIDLRSLSMDELTEQLVARGFPAFRARQIRQWLDRGVTDFEQMTNIPKDLRAQLSEVYTVPTVRILRKLVSEIDGTVKYLFGLDDGETVESVLMQYKHGWSQCLSTQVGCRMGCTFCATGMGGLVRNLSAAEMMAQIEAAQQERENHQQSFAAKQPAQAPARGPKTVEQQQYTQREYAHTEDAMDAMMRKWQEENGNA